MIPSPRQFGICARCANGYVRAGTSHARYCLRCMQSNREKNRASAAVYKAVLTGVLPRPGFFFCTDCDRPASEYDHRDYAKPLAVEPVCRRCNFRRGPAMYGRAA